MAAKNGWSFCIVTSGTSDAVLERCISCIRTAFLVGSNYEIIVVGNSSIVDNSVTIIPFKEEIFSLPVTARRIKTRIRNRSLKRMFINTGWITRKKNIAVQTAKYDKLCIMHDYIGLDEGWYAGFREFGDNWDVCMTKVVNADGKRHRDWMTWDYPEIGPGLLPYHAYCDYMYISGAYFCVKREFMLQNPLNERLFWGEGEDVEWSKRVRIKTKFKMNILSTVKYLKMKPENEAPNCSYWTENSSRLLDIFGPDSASE